MDEELVDIYDYDCEKTCSMLISLRKKLESIKRLKTEIDEVIDFHKRASRTHGIDDVVKARINTRIAISKRLGKILGADSQ